MSAVPSAALEALLALRASLDTLSFSDAGGLLAGVLPPVFRLFSCSAVSLLFRDSGSGIFSIAVRGNPDGSTGGPFPASPEEMSAACRAAENAFFSAEEMAAPLVSEGTCFAVLRVAGKTPPDVFSEADALVFRLLASLTAGFAVRCPESACCPAGSGKIRPPVAVCAGMREILALVKRVADTGMPVLFSGERGTGKKYFAFLLHTWSRRAAKPFVCINCADAGASCPDPETAIFGARGIAGAIQDAGGGTLFLENPEEIPSALQEKLLHALQPAADSAEKNAPQPEYRLVAASGCDLEPLVAAGKFRAGLYFALNVLPLHLPPLRARREDLSALALSFLTDIRAKLGRPFSAVAEDAWEMLLTHSWPGNLDELRNVLERACILGSPPCIQKENLLLNNPVFSDNNKTADKTLKTVLAALKKEYVTRILAENSWNQTAAARVLAIQRTYLSRLIKELGIREK